MPRRKPSRTADELRRHAEQQLKGEPPHPPVSADEALRMLHELQVHQIELQMQNEALQQAEAEAQEALSRLHELNQSMEDRIVQRTAELVVGA